MLRRVAVLIAICAGAATADTLEGRVVEDHSNNPLASVELRVYRIGQRHLAAELETDTAGRFMAEGLLPGEYRIEAAKANYIGATLRRNGVSRGMVIRLVRSGVISGVVLDAQGQPVRGAAVYVMPKPADGGPLRTSLNPWDFTQAGERGQYRVHSLAPGEYAVAVSYGASPSIYGSTGGGAPRAGVGSGVQFYPSNARPQIFAVAGGEEYRNIDFSITPGILTAITGKIDLPDPKTKYWLALISPDQPSLAAAVTATKEDGAFEFESIPAGAYTLTASGPVGGYGGRAVLGPEPFFGRTRISAGSTKVEGVPVPVQKGRSLSFILRSAGSQQEGACPPSAQLTLTALEDWAAALDRTAELNFRKEQTIDHIAPARFQIVMSRLGESCYQPAPAILDLSGAAPQNPVTVLVAPAGAIHGKLTGTVQPKDFVVALVAADPLAGAQPLQVAFPDEAGRFSFGALRPGPYRIAAQLAGEASKARWVSERARMIEIQIVAGAPTEMELPAPPPVRQ